jgi:sec-independent protein translocase protein TatA
MHIGLPEILIVLVIVIILFGVGRISKLGSELGSGLRNFRDGLKGEKENENEKVTDKKSK